MRYRSVLSATISLSLLAGACTGAGSDLGATTTTPAATATTTSPAVSASPSDQTVATDVKTVRYKDVRAFIEDNSTDRDLGFHFELGGDPFATVTLTDPNGNVILDLANVGALAQQGLSSIFVESAEYGFKELSKQAFLARFPEGTYTFLGQALDGRTYTGTWEFTHLIPDPTTVISPAEGATVDRGAVTIDWEPVTTPAGVEVEVYQLEVFPVDPPKGQPPIDLHIDYFVEVPPTVTEMKVPAEILTPGEDYLFELIVVDITGNQTIHIGSFRTSR